VAHAPAAENPSATGSETFESAGEAECSSRMEVCAVSMTDVGGVVAVGAGLP